VRSEVTVNCWDRVECEVRLTEEDVDADESNEGALSDEVLNADSGTDTSDNELADGHSDSAEEQKRPPAPCLDKV
jgi:hypothetical protein